MDAGEWEEMFAHARRQLFQSHDVSELRSRGHDLKNGVVLTSVSDVPFEMSLKCICCGGVFWFENASWSTGGVAEWHISSISSKDAGANCGNMALPA
jgi:hypothetical protein